MEITKLTKIIKEEIGTRSVSENIEMLKDAGILDEDGYYSEELFSTELVQYDTCKEVK